MNFKKILALVLVVAMCLSMVPTYAFAEDVELWDEDEVAVQNDAPLEDEYIDEDPVEQEPAEEEPAATDPEQPAAEEPAAEEPTGTNEVLGSSETNEFDAAIVIKNITQDKDYEATQFETAISEAAAGDQIMVGDNSVAGSVDINKSLTLIGSYENSLNVTINVLSGTVTLKNFSVNTINVAGGTLSIPEGDTAQFGTVKALNVTSGDVKGGIFNTSLSTVLLAKGYVTNTGKSINGTVSGTVVKGSFVAKVGNDLYTTLQDAIDNATAGSTITLLDNITVVNNAEKPNALFTVDKNLTIDGDSHTITASGVASTVTTVGHVFNINGGAVTLKNLTIDGVNKNARIGVHVYKDTAGVTLNNVTVKNCTLGVCVNGSKVTATNLYTSGNEWGGVNVESMNGNSEFTISSGKLEEAASVYSEDSSSGGASGNNNKVTITGGDFNGVQAKAKADVFAISGGTYLTEFPDTYCAEGFILVKKDDGTYGVDSGTYVARVADMVQKNVDYTTLGQGYTTLDEAIAAAKAPVEEGKPEHVLVILNKVKSTDKIALNDGEKINIWYKAGIALADRYAKENFEVGEYVKVEEIGAQYYVHTWAATGYLALVSTKGSTDDPATFMTLDDAVREAANAKNKVLKVLKATDTDITLTGEGAYINIDETEGQNVSVKAADGFVAVPVGEGIVTYVARKAVASYVDADGDDVYTMTFAEAATKGATNADYEGKFTVTLYQAPDFNANDVYALGANYTLTVVATNSDLKDKLEAPVGNYKAPLYKLMVTNDGEVAVQATHTARDDNFVYTAKTPVAKAPLNTAEVTYQYFATFDEAIKFVVEEHYNDNLYLIPMANWTFKVNADQIAGTGTLDSKSYVGKDIRIDNSGEHILKLADVDLGSGDRRYYTYSVNTEASTENYTSYTLKDAAVKIPAKEEMNIYYDVVDGTNTKFFASFADAVAADSTAVIELIATPTDVTGTTWKYTTETYKLGEPEGPTTVKAKLGEFGWLKVDPYSDDQAVVGDTDKDGITTYTLTGAVASITTGTGAQAHTDKYATFKEAADRATDTDLTVKLLAIISDEYELANGATLKVNKNTFDVKVVAAGEEPTYAIKETTDKNGITTYTSVSPVAKINFGTDDEEKYTLYATFAEAAKAAFTPAGTEDALVIELCQNPVVTDQYEVTAAGYFLVDNKGLYTASIETANLKYADGVAVVKPATAVNVKDTIWKVTVAAAAASVDLGSAKPDVHYYATFADAAEVATATTLASAKTIKLYATVEDEYELATNAYMKVEKNSFNLDVKAAKSADPTRGFIADAVTDPETGITTYSPVYAQASVGTGTDIEFYKEFTVAATEAAETKVITLYNTSTAAKSTYTYTLGAEGNVSKLIVDANDQTLTVTSGVTGKEVKKTGTAPATYTLVSPVAHIEENGQADKYYPTVADAVAAAQVGSAQTPTKTLVLDENVTANITISDGKQIDLKAGSYLGNYKVVSANSTSGKPYFVVPTANGDVTNYKSVEAVASIQAAGATEPTYYATFAEAAGVAYVTGDAKPTLTVKIYKQPQGKSTNPKDVPDLFTVTEAGSILVDQSSAKTAVLKPNFDLADGLVYLPETTSTADVYLIKVAEAEAYTIRNNGKYDYYPTVAEAFKFSLETPSLPVVYLQKNELSYALAEGKTIRVDKNGHDDFIVTKATPSDLDPAYAIVETVSGTVSTYTTKTPVIAYILTEDEKPIGDGYDVQKIKNIAYYTNMAAASKASNGTETITLTATMTDVYKLSANETLIIDKTVNGYEPKLTADAGSAVQETKVQGKTTVYKYTVEQSVATVTYSDGTVTPFPTLTAALDEAVSNFDNNVYLTLTAPVEAGFTYTLGELDWVRMAKQDNSLKVSNFKVPGGMFANITEEPIGDTAAPIYYVVRPTELLASVSAGEKIQYFGTFTDAVKAAVKIEKDLGHYGDVNNPKSLITLYADNKDAYELDATDNTGNVESLRIKAGEHKPNLTAPTGYFVEEIPENEEGVSLYKLSEIVATVTSGPNNDRKTTNYSSFAAAANAAFNTVETVVLKKYVGHVKADDVYEMPVGTLNVTFMTGDTAKDSFAGNHIKAKGERTSFYSEALADGSYQYTVTGAVASITTPRGTNFYYSMFNAIKAAINNTNLVIVPLTDIDYYMTASEVTALGVTDVAGSKFNVADSEYDVNLRAEGYELVEKDNIYTFTDAVAFVTTDDVYAVNPETNVPTYIDQYFAKIDDAIDFADGEKTITLLANVSYKFEDVDTVAIIATPTNLTFTATLDEDLKDDYAVKETTAPNIKKYEVAAFETFRVEAGDGAWGTGTSALKFKETKAVAGASIKDFINNEAKIAEMVLTGYSIEYFVGSDGNNYVWLFEGDGNLTDAQVAAKCKFLPKVMPEGGLTLTAKWTANKYWVYLREAVTGSYIAHTMVDYNTLINVPENANVKDHYNFVGWYSDINATTVYDVTKTALTKFTDDGTPATGDGWSQGQARLVLYGKFVPKQYTVTFDTGCDVTIPDQTVAYGNKATQPNNDLLKNKRVGYTFAGTWHIVKADGTLVTWDFATDNVVGDTTLIADWTPKTLTLIFADGSDVLGRITGVNVGSNTDVPAPSYADRTNPGYRVDPDKAWIDENGELFNGKVPVIDKAEWIYQLNWIKQIEVTFIDGGKKVGSVLVDQGTTLANAKNVPAPTKEGYTLVWQLDGEDYDVKAPIQEDLLLTAYWAEGEDVRGYATVVSALQLKDNINVFAYVTIKENTLPSDYEVNVTFNGKTTLTGSLDSVGKYDPNYDEYKLTGIATIAVPQMNDAATVTITYQGKEVLTKDLSVRGYAEEWIEKSSDARLVNLLKALLDFGAYGQLQFNYQTDNLVNSKYSTGKVPATVVPVYPITTDGEVTGITGASISLTLLSNTTMNVFIGVAKKGNYTFTVDGVEADAEYSNKEYKLSVKNINVADLDDEHVITATLGDETYTVTVAPLAYAYQHQGNDSLGNVCKAVYLYYDAADAYFG